MRLFKGAALASVTFIVVWLCLRDWTPQRADLTKALWSITKPERSGFKMPYPECELAINGLSPNKQCAFVLIPPQPYDGSNVSNVFNCVMSRTDGGKYLALPTHIQTSSAVRESYYGVVRWASDSSAVLCFNNCDRSASTGVFARGAYDVYVVPIVQGRTTKAISLEYQVLEAAFPADAKKAEAGQFKDIPAMYVQLSDRGMDDNLTFNSQNQIIVDCWCSSTPRETFPNSASKAWTTVQIKGVWDIPSEKFIASSVTPVDSTN